MIAPGLLTTVQDLGRWGTQSRGVPVAGPMDGYAHRVANALAGNSPDAATLEMTLAGPEIEFDDDRVVAVAGAPFDLTVDSEIVSMHRAIEVKRGARLKVRRCLKGARAYLAVGGGIAVPPVLGSRATHLRTAMGGFKGRALKAADVLPLGPPAVPPRHHPLDASASADYIPVEASLRLLRGPQADEFSEGAWRLLLRTTYTIDRQSDRMAFRLAGPPLPSEGVSEMISDATPMGTLQVLPSGRPLLLMADRQTTGGYPQIGTVCTADLRVAGQLAPGRSVSFTLCSMGDAMAALIAQERVVMRLEGGAAP